MKYVPITSARNITTLLLVTAEDHAANSCRGGGTIHTNVSYVLTTCTHTRTR